MMTSAAGKSNIIIPNISLSDCFIPNGDIDHEEFIQQHQILMQNELASKDVDRWQLQLYIANIPAT